MYSANTAHNKCGIWTKTKKTKIQNDNNRIVKTVVLYFGGIDKDNPRVEIKIYDI